MKNQSFPTGWNEERVRAVLQHYEEQSEVEAVAEDEGRFHAKGMTAMDIPTELVPEVRALLAAHGK